MKEPVILNEITMTYINKKKNSQKYYIAKLVSYPDTPEWGYIAVYGRLDRPIAEIQQDNRKWTNISPKNFASLTDAENHFQKKCREKMKKDYAPLLERDSGSYQLAYCSKIAEVK